MIFVTYRRLPPDTRDATDDLYHVSGNGLAGGLSRVLVELNFPIALVAAPFTLVAMDALPRSTWALAAPAIALSAVVAWPGVVDQDDLDARVVNVIPALGVALAFGLTLAASRRAGRGVAGRLPLDAARVGIAAVVLVLSIPWIAAELGVFLPDGVFIMRRVATRHGRPADRRRPPRAPPRLRRGARARARCFSRGRACGGDTPRACHGRPYGRSRFAYGIVNLPCRTPGTSSSVKRGTLDWKIPGAILPSLSWIWIAILVLAALTALALRAEPRSVDSPG